MLQTFKYRVYPTSKQAIKILRMLDLCRNLYNAALEQRIYAQDRGLKIGYVCQQNELPALKVAMPEYKEVYSHTLQDVLKRLDMTYVNYFRRCKEKKSGKNIRVGFPKFKSRLRYRSITYPDSENGSYVILNSTHLKISKIGTLRFFQHRPIPIGGVIKTMIIKRDSVGDWYVTFTVYFPNPEPVIVKSRVGVDVGLKNLAVVSSGEFYNTPKFFIKGLNKIKVLQGAFARCVNNSKNYEKIRVRIAKAHRKIERQRNDYLHKISRYLVDTYDVIVFEKLQITNMVKNHCLAKAILDAAWGKLREFTSYKAENAGKLCPDVPPQYTSMTCNRCGARQQISLSDRIFSCRQCGQTSDRDWNAALNIRDRDVRPDWTELLNNARRDMNATSVLNNHASSLREAGSPRILDWGGCHRMAPLRVGIKWLRGEA